MFLGDESYGRNKGYYVLLDTFRDIFERGGEKNWRHRPRPHRLPRR
jgi:tryptophanase